MTRQFALVGFPIDASPSPAMHNAGFAALGLDAHYTLRPSQKADVPAVLRDLQNGVLHGVNVTTPLKTEFAPHVRCVGDAMRAGAVNTIVMQDGALVGHLTDVAGVREPLRAHEVEPGGRGLILGAGGASRAAVLALAALGLTVDIAARRRDEAERLLRELAPESPGEAVDLADRASMLQAFGDASVIVQATPLGKNGERHDLPWALARRYAVAFDMLYRPQHTPFTQAADEHGLRVVYGWQMLLAQGLEAFTLFTGAAAPHEAMEQALKLSF